MKTAVVALVVLSVVLLGGGAYFFNDAQRARQESEDSFGAKEELAATIETLRQNHGDLQTELDLKATELHELTAAHRKMVDDFKVANEKLATELEHEIRANQIQVTHKGNSLSVRLIGNILFPSGGTQLTPAGIKVLQRVGNIIRKVKNKAIRVEGHTDNVPCRNYGNVRRFSNNWELSAARATNVVSFFVNQVGIPPERLEAVALSEHHPVADNSTSEGRSHNRRIELLLVPMKALESSKPISQDKATVNTDK